MENNFHNRKRKEGTKIEDYYCQETAVKTIEKNLEHSSESMKLVTVRATDCLRGRPDCFDVGALRLSHRKKRLQFSFGLEIE